MNIKNTIKTVIAIPTCHRDDTLLRLLKKIDAILHQRADVAILVIDNGNSTRLAGKLKLIRFNLRIFLKKEHRRGLATVRNRLIDEALKLYPHSTYIAMLDDDSLIKHNWLFELESVADSFNADLTGGLQTLEPKNLGSFARQSVLGNRINQSTGITTHLYGTHNLLIRLSLLKKMERPYFDENFNLSGGEDTEFFLRAKKSNAIFAWSSHAIVYECAAEKRLKWYALLKRHYAMGQCYSQIARKHFTFSHQLRLLITMPGKALTTSLSIMLRQGLNHAFAAFMLYTSDAMGYMVGFIIRKQGRYYHSVK